MDSNSVPSTLTSNHFGTSTICWYRFYPSSSSFKSINIKIEDLTNANAEVYLESSSNNYEYKGSLSSGNSLKITIGSNNPVWVLVTPLSSSAYVSITGTASTSSTDNSISTTLVISFSIVFGWTTLTTFFLFMLYWVGFVSIFYKKIENQSSEEIVQDPEYDTSPRPAPTLESAPQPFDIVNL